jgi:Helix-turn-helix of DDE superfamily endonuclease/DDE superfamily endonuclease
MIEFATLKRNRRKFLALTGLTLKEFNTLLPAFGSAYLRQYPHDKTVSGRTRNRQHGGGRHSVLNTMEQKLLFILVYLKTYPLQVVTGELFGMSQSGTNHWIHRLLPFLRTALADLGVRPEREGHQFARAERRTAEPRDYIIDGTERRRQRPKDPEKQALFYSGKKKVHSHKNVVVVNTRSKRVGYLSSTYAGKTHDKKVADQEQIAYPKRAHLHKDTAFQGYEPEGTHTHQPKKSRAGKS